ncbi:pyruvate dehydrogenase complex dihydrolipoamide acetyltransferase [Ruegeria sp. HKCCD8929]|uniref:pyruvate dehydrogenase complex dihydrolipoamide acetyltransferase n=1 Tax=Ruegeria sp. HKCCD8929 TaxID=2683006 RepID=UPI00148A04B1|nr:pyruvate dehydrogenase complex dihydrolipoamide acetyltransferase [Ruegeria sp. HKCCD8929]
MPIEITMPALSPTMEEGTLASWLVSEGDQVRPGDIIAEIETDKATMEFEAADAGTVARILVLEGTENVAVNTPIAVFAEDGEDAATIEVAERRPTKTSADATGAKNTKTPVLPIAPEGAGTGDRVFASPLAKRIAVENKIDLSRISGTGQKGRIVRVDVEAALSKPFEKPPQEKPVAPAPTQVSDLYLEGSYEVVELDSMRRTIARRLTEAKQTVPHFYLRRDVELDALLALRAQINATAPVRDETRAYKISVNDLMIKALALALAEVPDANVTWADGNVRRHRAVDVAVAVAIDGGLITPIIRNAEAKSVSAISTEMKDLAARARARKLAPDEFQGGTTSVSNLGMFGVSSFDAVINPPQGTILAVGAGERRPLVRADQIEIATVMTVSLSVDHRMVDGALGADLLTTFKRYVEAPLTILS